MNEMCACGKPLHYKDAESRARVQALIDKLGECVAVEVAGVGKWLVPRHYIALHGVRSSHLPNLAAKFGWEKV